MGVTRGYRTESKQPSNEMNASFAAEAYLLTVSLLVGVYICCPV